MGKHPRGRRAGQALIRVCAEGGRGGVERVRDKAGAESPRGPYEKEYLALSRLRPYIYSSCKIFLEPIYTKQGSQSVSPHYCPQHLDPATGPRAPFYVPSPWSYASVEGQRDYRPAWMASIPAHSLPVLSD